MRVMGLLLFVISIVVVAILFLRLNDYFMRRRFAAKGESKVLPRAPIESLSHAQFDEAEQLFGKVPERLKGLYRQRELVDAKNVSFADSDGVERVLTRFLTLDRGTLSEIWPGVWKHELPFADAGDGDYFVVNTSSEPVVESPVHLFFHDGGDRERVASTIEEFIGQLRAGIRKP